MKIKMIIASVFFVSSVQAATLTPATGVEILFVNGIKNEEKREAVDVDASKVQLLLRYNKQVGSGNSKKVFDSAPYIMSLDVEESNLTITAPKVYSYEQATLEFKNKPEWVITDSKGSAISYTQIKLPPEEGFMPYYDLDSMLKKYNESQNTSFNVKEKNETLAQNNQSEPSLEQLKQDYLQINKKDRKAFQKWIIDQD